MNFMEVWLIKTSFHFVNLLYLFSIVIRIHEQWFDWFDCLTYPNIKASFLNDRLHATHNWSKGLFSLVWTFMTIHRISIFNTLLSGFFKFSIFSHLLLLAVIFGLLCGSVVCGTLWVCGLMVLGVKCEFYVQSSNPSVQSRDISLGQFNFVIV